MFKILQWNCQGYRAKYEDLCRLLHTVFPAIALLQETMLNETEPRPPTGYCLYSSFRTPVPGNGLVALFRRDIPHAQLDLRTTLQAFAFRTCLSRQCTVCNLYISPNQVLAMSDIVSLLDQLPEPVMIFGDFNCRHPLWDSEIPQPDARALVLESVLLSSSLSASASMNLLITTLIIS